MTEKEWQDEARLREEKAREAYERGDEVAGEMYERKAAACRHNACYGIVD